MTDPPTPIVSLTDTVSYCRSFPYGACVRTPDGVIAFDGPMLPRPALAWRDFLRTQGPLRFAFLREHHMDHLCAATYLEPEMLVASEITDREFYKSIASDAVARQRLLSFDPTCEDLIDGFALRRPDIVYANRSTTGSPSSLTT